MNKPINPAYLDAIQKTIKKRFAINLEPHQIEAVEHFIIEQIETQSMRDYEEFIYNLENTPTNTTWLINLIDKITIEESYFFRDPNQFSWIKDYWLPTIYEKNHKSRTINIWSAATSYGQEAYSLAMLLKQENHLIDWDINIYASDLNPKSINIARQGEYSSWSLRALDSDTKAKFFTENNQIWKIDDEIIKSVKFFTHNLNSAFPAQHILPESLDLILCRNLIIYFSQDNSTKLLDLLCQGLKPDGVILLGASDFVSNIPPNLSLSTNKLCTYYSRVSPSSKEGPPKETSLAPTKSTTESIPAITIQNCKDILSIDEINSLIFSKNRKETDSKVSELLEQHATNHLPWLVLGVLALQDDRIDEAYDAFKKSLFLDSNIPETHYFISIIESLQANRLKAVKSMENAVTLCRTKNQNELVVGMPDKDYHDFEIYIAGELTTMSTMSGQQNEK